MKKSIGILGGMGPLATADLFRKLILFTDAEGDHDHIRIYIDNNPAIPDRTAALLSGGDDPLPAMTDSLRKLEACGASCILMPCNTAHCFLPRLQPLTALPFLSMPEAAAKACAARFPGKTAAVLATRGTLSSGLYQDALSREQVPFLLPDDGQQEALMRVIYEGVKAGRAPAEYQRDLDAVVRGLATLGADFFLLGCTELPLAVSALGWQLPVMDPTEELAKAAIRFAGVPVRNL